MKFFGSPAERGPQPVPLTPEMQALSHVGFGPLAELLSGETGRQRIRNAWGDIDDSLTGRAAHRIFAGVSQDASRYYEVYAAGQSAKRWIFVGDLSADDGSLVCVDGKEEFRTRGGKMEMSFVDPTRPESSEPVRLHLRHAVLGTSSYYDRDYSAYVRDGRGHEVFPMAVMQRHAGFDTSDLRVSECDTNGSTGYGGLRINQPEPPEPPRDWDDIAV